MSALGWLNRLLGKRDVSRKRSSEGLPSGGETSAGRGQGLTSPENFPGIIIPWTNPRSPRRN